MQTGVYDLPLVHYEVKAVMTNTAPVGAYRGAGRPEGVFIVERLMDAAARQIGMDPRAIRKVNYIKPAQLPYTNAVGQVYDSGAFAHMLERASKLADWDGFAARKKAAKKKGLLYGRGLTSYIEWTGGRAHTEKVSLHATAEGRVILHSGTMAMGQGLQTTYTQMIVGIARHPHGQDRRRAGRHRSRHRLRQRRLALAVRRRHGGRGVRQRSDREGAREGRRTCWRPRSRISNIATACSRWSAPTSGSACSRSRRRKPARGCRVDSEGEVDGPSWPNGTHICEVEIDPETGVTRVVRYTTVDDVGVAVNPMLVTGQVHGGVAQGIGQALYEGVTYDAEGQLLTASYQDYCLPRADDIPPIEVTLDESARRAAPIRWAPRAAANPARSAVRPASPMA